VGSNPTFGTTGKPGSRSVFFLEEDMTQSSQPGKRAEPSGGWRIPFSNLQIILILLTIAGGSLVVNFRQRVVEGQQKLAEKETLEAEIDMLLQEQAALEKQKDYYNSPAFVGDWAHDQGKMVRPGETLVIPVYERQEQVGDPVVISSAENPLPEWQLWWSLFFDGPPPFADENR
jgi:cell division protein FtsB